MKKLLFILILILFVLPARAQDRGVFTARVIKLNFVTAHEVVSVLSAMKSPEGKVVVNEEGRSIAIMDTSERVAAMDTLVRQMDIQTVSAAIPLQFGRADEAVGEVRGFLTQSVGMISTDNTTNAVLVTDTPAVVDRVRRTVAAFDQRGRKFVFEAKLIHITLDDEHLQGVDWAGIVADHQQFKLEGAYEFLSRRGYPPVLSFGTIEDKDLTPLIEALDTVGLVREYPVVDVMAGTDAGVRLVVRFDEPVLMLAVGDEDPAAGAAQALVFSVKASVDADGGIKTVISPREIPAALKAAGVKPLSGINRPRAATIRTLENGTIILGGLITSDNVLTPRRVPLIGDLPILGLAFRYHNSTVRREEFVILLTPKPVAQDPAPAAVDSKAGR